MSTTSMRIFAGIGIICLVAGLVGWILQLTGGLISGSGMTNIFLWGLMIALFAFMVGFGAGCQLVASAIYLFGDVKMRSIARIAAAIGLACVGAAGVAILADLGAARNIMAMIIGLNLRSPLAWDMIAITAFIVVSIIELVMIARDASSVKVWAAIAGIFAVVLQIVEGLLFSTQTAHAWWASPIMPIDFLVVAFVSGSALMLLVSAIKGSDASALRWIGRLCAWAIALHLVLALIDLGIVTAEGTPEAQGVLDVLGSYLILYICELGLPAIAMVLIIVGIRSSKGADGAHATDNKLARLSIWASIITIVGIFLHRLMLLYPAYNAPSLYLTLGATDATTGPYPISTGRYLDWDTTFAQTTAYLPSPIEVLAGLLPFGVAIVATFAILWVMRKIGKDVR